MAKAVHTIPITQIILDEEIYPRSAIYPKRVSMFAENIRDGFEIDPIEVQVHPEGGDKYRILDGAHRLQAYKEIGATELPVHIITLDGLDPSFMRLKRRSDLSSYPKKRQETLPEGRTRKTPDCLLPKLEKQSVDPDERWVIILPIFEQKPR